MTKLAINNSSLLASPEEFVPRIVYLFLVVIATIFGNLLVIVAVARFKKLHRSTNLILASLAMADLMSGLVTVPLYILWTIDPEVFDKSGFLCRFVLLSCLLLVAASQVSLLVLSFERYLAVCQPFRHRSLLIHCPWIHKVAICFIWVVSAVATAVSSLAIRPDYLTCSYYGVFDKMFLFLAVIFGVLVMFMAIIVINIKVLCSVRKNEKMLSVVELSNLGDHRNSSYLCHQDALECHPDLDLVAEKRECHSRRHSHDKRNEMEEETTQTLLRESDDDVVNDDGDGDSDDKDGEGDNDTDGNAPQISFLFFRSKSSKCYGRGSCTSGYENVKQGERRGGSLKLNKRSLRTRRQTKKGTNASENETRGNENTDEWVEYTKQDGEMLTEKIQDIGKLDVPTNKEQIYKDFEHFGCSLNDLNNPRQSFKDIASIQCLFGSGLQTEKAKPSNTTTENNDVFKAMSFDSISPKMIFNTDTIPLDKQFTKCVIDSMNSAPLPNNKPVDSIFQLSLSSTDSPTYCKSAETLTSSTTTDIMSPIVQSMFNVLHDSTPNNTLSLPQHKEQQKNCTKRKRKMGRCYPDGFNAANAWQETWNDSKRISEKEDSEMLSYDKAKQDLFLSLPFTMSPNLHVRERSIPRHCSFERLQYLHLESKACLQSKRNIPADRKHELTVQKPAYSVSLHDVYRTSLKPEDDNKVECGDTDFSTDLSNSDDTHPLISNPGSHKNKTTPKFPKSFFIKHSPKRHIPRRYTKFTKFHRSSHNVSIKNTHSQTDIDTNLDNSFLHPNQNSTFMVKGESVPDILSLDVRTLPKVPDPVFGSCPGFCIDPVQPKSKSSRSSPATPVNNDTTRMGDSTLELNIPCSLSFDQNCGYQKVEPEEDCNTTINEPYRNQTKEYTSVNQRHPEYNSPCTATENNDDISKHNNITTSPICHNDNTNAGSSNDIDISINITDNSRAPSTTSNHSSTLVNFNTHNNNTSNRSSIFSTTDITDTKKHSSDSGRTTTNTHNTNKKKMSTVSYMYNSHNNNGHYTKKQSTASRSRSFRGDPRRKSSSVTNQRQAYISKKVARTVTLVCSSFILAWLPFFVVIIYNTFCVRCDLDYALNAVLMVAFGQSAFNPIIYALCHASFRRAYESLLTQVYSKAGCHLGCRSTMRCSRGEMDSLDTD